MSQLTIVTTPQNSGEGTPLATAFNYTNSNFTELYARYQTTVPASLTGKAGDVPGMYASDSNYFYYCFGTYNGTSTIWAQVTQVANIAVSSIQSGNSNVTVAGAGANITIGIAGTSNVAVFANTGAYVRGIISATGNVSANYILGNGSQLTGLPSTYNNTNVAIFLGAFGSNSISTTGTVTSGNITATYLNAGNNISAAGNITGNYILGNGSQLTGLPALYGDANVVSLLSGFGSNTISTTGNITVGNATATNFYTSGIVSATGNVRGGNITTLGNVNAQGIISASGNIVTNGYFVGTFVGNVTGNFVVPGANTEIIFNTSGNADAVAGLTYNKDSNTLTVLGIVSSQGNVIGGNIISLDNITATNTVAGNLVTANLVNSVGGLTANGLITTTGNVFAGNISTTGLIVAAGNITGGNLLSQASISAVGNITANNITSTGAVSAAGNITGGNIFGSGILSTTGNVIGGNLTVTGVYTTTINATGFIAAPLFSAVGNVTAGNLNTSGIVLATGNVIGGNINTGGIISAVGNIAGGNLSITNINAGGYVSAVNHFGTTVSVIGNVTGSNLLTGGNISAGGNVTGNYIFGNGSQLTGLPALYGNANVAAFLGVFGSNNLSTTGTVTAASTAGGIITGNTVTLTGNISTSGNITSGSSSVVYVTNTADATGVNTGALQVYGGASFGLDIWVAGNVYAGNIVATQANILTVEDPLLYLYSANTYPYNYDIGFYSHFSTTGPYPGNGYQHTGMVRDFNDNTWKLFSNVGEPALGVVTFNGNTVYDAFKSGSQTVVGTISASGNITGNNLITAGVLTVNSGNADTAIVNAAGNSIGNIGSSSAYFNTLFATATTALYADLAENYQADADYESGTVVVFGGEAEVTVTTEFANVAVAGAVSTTPAYLMNSGQPGVPVALRGRIPVKVVGPVYKGDLLVTAGANPGYAVSVGKSTNYPLAVFAKSIETNADEGVKVIIAVIL